MFLVVFKDQFVHVTTFRELCAANHWYTANHCLKKEFRLNNYLISVSTNK